MPNIQFNTKQQRRVPITRNGLFYDREQFNFDMELGREYVEGDMGQRVILYSVNLPKSNQDKLYGEIEKDKIVCDPPVEIPCVYEIEDAELKGYDKTKNLGTYQKLGKLHFHVYQSTLDEIGVDIKTGDYIGVQIDERQCAYWSVENDGRDNYSNKYLAFGTIPYYRSITCRPADEFNI